MIAGSSKMRRYTSKMAPSSLEIRLLILLFTILICSMPLSTAPRKRSISRVGFGLLLVYRAQIHPRLQHIGASSTESRCRGQSVQSSAPALMGPRRLLPSPAFIRTELAHRLDHALLIFFPFFFLGP